MAFLKKMVKEAKNVLGDSEDKGRVLSSKLHPDVFRLFFYNLTSLTNLYMEFRGTGNTGALRMLHIH